MQKLTITNRKQQRIVVLIEEANPQKGLAFLMHGLSGFKEENHLIALAETFVADGYTTIRFDTTNTFGESDGNYEDATTTNYIEDLEDVIAWAKTQSWYQEPFVLAGHSLGGISVGIYAERYPEKVKGVAPISSAISGALRRQTNPAEVAEWERTGWRTNTSTSRPGLVMRLKWSHMVDAQQYDLLAGADKLTMPVLLIVGDQDTRTPAVQQEMLYDRLPGKKEIHLVAGAGHNYRTPEQLAELKALVHSWLITL